MGDYSSDVDIFFDAVENENEYRDCFDGEEYFNSQSSTNSFLPKIISVDEHVPNSVYAESNSKKIEDFPAEEKTVVSKQNLSLSFMEDMVHKASRPEFRATVSSTSLAPFTNTISEPKSNLSSVPIRDVRPSLFNSRENLRHMRGSNQSSTRSADYSGISLNIVDESGEVSDVSEGSARKKKPRKKKFFKRKSINSSNKLPLNGIPLRSTLKEAASESMLLIYTSKKAHEGPIWVMQFSHDKNYFATAGEDKKILIWSVSQEKSNSEESDQQVFEDSLFNEIKSETVPLGNEIQVLSNPIQCYTDHTEDIVDFSWNRTNFLLSASLDKTVRLWHVSRSKCLHIFSHTDLITSVDFHPFDDSFFVSGGFDKRLRVWSIPDRRVTDWTQTPHVITALRYTPSGLFIVAGLIQGQAYFYTTEDLKYYTQISCRNRHGRTKYGTKITGLSFVIDSRGDDVRRSLVGRASGVPVRSDFQLPKSSVSATSSKLGSLQIVKYIRVSEQLLVTTNDSRIRLFGLHDYCMVSKYKGLRNINMQIKARFSESGKCVICGSEDSNVYMWKTNENKNLSHLKYFRNKRYDWFQATKSNQQIVTDALFVPEISVKRALLRSNLFPTLSTMRNINYDFSSSMIVTSDYDGTIRIFVRKSCLDQVLHAAGPVGYRG